MHQDNRSHDRGGRHNRAPTDAVVATCDGAPDCTTVLGLLALTLSQEAQWTALSAGRLPAGSEALGSSSQVQQRPEEVDLSPEEESVPPEVAWGYTKGYRDQYTNQRWMKKGGEEGR